MTDSTKLARAIARHREVEGKATKGPWEFRAGDDAHGDSCDLLMAEIGVAAGDEDPEYAEVLFGEEFGETERGYNWDEIRLVRNSHAAFIDLWEAAGDTLISLEAAGLFPELRQRLDAALARLTEGQNGAN